MDKDSSIVICTNCGAKNRIPIQKKNARARCGKCHKPMEVDSPMGVSYPVEVSDISFQNEIISHTGAVLVDFWAPWCGPCQSLAHILEQLAIEYSGKVKIAKVNVDNNPRTTSHYNIRSVPSLLLFRNGKLVDSLVGAQHKSVLMRHLDSFL